MPLPFILFWVSIFTLNGVSSSLTPILTTNASIVALGRPFTAKCQLANDGKPSQTAFTGGFFRDGDWILQYTFPAASLSGVRTPRITLNPSHYRDLEVVSLRASPSTFEAQITPKTLTSHVYSCSIDGRSLSAPTRMTVLPSLPNVTFTLNTTHLTIGQPFKATCNLANAAPTPASNYTVSFYNKAEGLLASYQIKSVQNQVIIMKHANLILHFGPRTAFPTFDLLITERTDTSSEYWCALEETNWTLPSAHWSSGPLVDFTSFKVNETSRLGTCSVGHFEPAGRNYSIVFLTDMGPKSANILATYAIRPERLLEFDIEAVPGWTKVASGEKVTFPEFPIAVTASALKGKWWCLLSLGEDGDAHFPQFKSEKVDLE